MPACMKRIRLAMTLPIVAMTTLIGCNPPPGNGSACVDVTLGGTTTCVPPDEGAVSLANTRWTLLDEQGNAFITLVFDDGGNLVEFADSPLLSSLLGSNILLDDQPHDTGIVDQLKYTAVSFEVVGDPVGSVRDFTIQTNVSVFFATGLPFIGNIDVAAGTANATGTIDGDTMTGEFVFNIEIDPGVQSLAQGLLPADIPLDNVNQTLTFTAVRSAG